MEQIFRLYDPSPEGVSIGNYLQIGVLGYADDAALTSKDIEKLSQRLTNIDRGSFVDADMSIHPGKTKTMHVEPQAELPIPTREQVQSTQNKYSHECEFCGRKFKTSRGRNIHRASCNSRHELSKE